MKSYYTYTQIHKLVQTKSKEILSIFRPEVILAIGGGGYIPARIARTWIDNPILGVGIQLYDFEDKAYKEGPRKFQWLDQNALDYIRGKRVLIVDEVDDTRKTLHFVVEELHKIGVKEIGVFVLHNKKKDKKPLDIKPEFYFAAQEVRGDTWIVYPWEADDIDQHNVDSMRQV